MKLPEAKVGRIPVFVREQLDRHHWQDSIPRLTRYALSQIKARIWYLSRGGEVAAGRMAEDFVMRVIVKVYNGERNWDPDKSPDLFLHLAGILRSEINHHCMSRENRTMVYLEAVSFGGAVPTDSRQNSGARLMAGEFLEAFLRFLDDDAVLKTLVEHIMAGAKPRDMADALDRDRKEIYNLLKKLRRRFENFSEQWKETPSNRRSRDATSRRR